MRFLHWTKRQAIAVAACVGLSSLALAQGINPPVAFFNGVATAPSISGQSTGASLTGLSFGTFLTRITGHLLGSNGGQAAPVLSNAGASPLVTAGSSDIAGQFSSTSGTTTGTLTFNTAYATAPFCVVQEQGGTVAPTYTVSATQIVVTVLVAATNYNYVCIGGG